MSKDKELLELRKPDNIYQTIWRNIQEDFKGINTALRTAGWVGGF
jgi:hypothetical protein